MRHANELDLENIGGLLARLDDMTEGNKVLKRRKVGIYNLGPRAFLHFHEDKGSIYADIRLEGDDFVRLDISSKSDQSELVNRVEGVLAK